MSKGSIFVLGCLIAFRLVAQHPFSQSRDERLFNAGLDLMAHGEYGAARENFQQFLSNYSVDDFRKAEAEYYQAFCALNLFHNDGERHIEDFVREYPNHPRAATAYFDLANFFYTERNYGRAANYYDKVDFTALTVNQHNTGRFRWGYSLFNQRKLPAALDQFNFIKALGGEYGPAASYYAGYIEFESGDYANALTDLRRADQTDSYQAVVPQLLAGVLYRTKNYDELLRYTGEALNRDNVNGPEEIRLLAAEAYYRKGELDKALEGYEPYIDLKKYAVDAAILLRAGYSAYSLNKDDQAIDYLKRSASDKDSVGCYASYYLGSLYLKKGQKPLALNAFDAARELKADARLAEESTFTYAKIAYELGQPDKSIAELEKFMTTYPNSGHVGEVKELLSQAYVNANNYNKAIEYIESLPRRGPAIDRAYQKATMLKAMELFNMEEYAQSVQYFEKSLELPVDPAYTAEASFWCGEAYSIGRKYEEAVPHYLRVIGLNGYENNDVIMKSRYGLGYAFYNQQDYERALFNFKEFVNKSSATGPNYGDAVVRLADCYYVTKAYADALAQYRRAMQIKTAENDYPHLQAGIILGIQRKYGEAAQELDQVIRGYPQSRFMDEALFQRAQLDFEQGNYAASVTGFGRLINQAKSSRFLPYAYMRRAASNYNLKDYNKTANDYISVVENYPSHPVANDALLPLQEALTLAGRQGEFDAYLASFKAANPEAKGIESVEYETAKNLYFSQDYQKAIDRLGVFVDNYPESARLTEARFYRAESFYRLRQLDKALEIYQEIAENKTFELSSRVTGRMAEVQFRLGNYQDAIKRYQELSRIAATKKDQFNAWSGLMQSHYFLAQYDSTDVYAKLILDKGNVNAGAQNMATLFLGKSAMARGNYDAAKDEFINALNTARDEYGAEAKYLLAEIMYLTKDHKQSNETLFGLIKDFSAYTEWVGKAYLLLADNYAAMGDLFQAKGTLKSLEGFPLENIKTMAREKLERIEKDEAKAEADTTQIKGNP